MRLKKALKIERNSLCSCGSGKKYKKCCFIREQKEAEQQREVGRAIQDLGEGKQD